MFDITRSDVPVLFNVACIVAFDPTDTLPKSRLGGVIPNAGATPVPCTEYVVGEPEALCVIVKSAVFSPVDAGANVTSSNWLPPAIIVSGNVFGVNVNCPSDDVMFDITRSDVPELLTVACNIAFEPTGTEPKFRFTGAISKIGTTPVPCTEYVVGEPEALCVIVKSAAFSPVDAGANVTSSNWLPPAIIVSGNVFGVNVNCPSDDVMFDITRSDVPELLTVACNIAFDPTGTEPKFRLTGAISNPCPKAKVIYRSTKESIENSLRITHSFNFLSIAS
jgi:hypothetical protein